MKKNTCNNLNSLIINNTKVLLFTLPIFVFTFFVDQYLTFISGSVFHLNYIIPKYVIIPIVAIISIIILFNILSFSDYNMSAWITQLILTIIFIIWIILILSFSYQIILSLIDKIDKSNETFLQFFDKKISLIFSKLTFKYFLALFAFYIGIIAIIGIPIIWVALWIVLLFNKDSLEVFFKNISDIKQSGFSKYIRD